MPPHPNEHIEHILHPNTGVRSNIDYVPLHDAGTRYKDLGRRATILLKETMVDRLTGLHSDKAFTASLEASVERENSEFEVDGEETNMAVLNIDVDGFKAVNDILGHQVGDEVLGLIGTALKIGTRDADIATHSETDAILNIDADETVKDTYTEPDADNASKAAREHGDEFKILVRNIVGTSTLDMTKQERLQVMTNRIREAVNLAIQNSKYNGTLIELGVGISVGSAIYRRGENIKDFLNRTDDAMYADKAERKAADSISGQ